jgi:imidazole glycerol-phosphate synthase subunit HisF
LLSGLALKVRIIPTILTDGLTVVKGENFDNWRTVGSAEATARLYASRDVDERLFLDVNARSRHTMIDKNLLAHFSDILDVPFSVGGGINTLPDAKICFRQGAEKIVLGTVALENPHIFLDIADVFGNQAIIVSIDFANDESVRVLTNSGKAEIEIEIFGFIDKLEALGAGEILLQSKVRDGTLGGMDLMRVSQISSITNLLIIAGSGVGSAEDCHAAL